jgi:hypothetical protein
LRNLCTTLSILRFCLFFSLVEKTICASFWLDRKNVSSVGAVLLPEKFDRKFPRAAVASRPLHLCHCQENRENEGISDSKMMRCFGNLS